MDGVPSHVWHLWHGSGSAPPPPPNECFAPTHLFLWWGGADMRRCLGMPSGPQSPHHTVFLCPTPVCIRLLVVSACVLLLPAFPPFHYYTPSAYPNDLLHLPHDAVYTGWELLSYRTPACTLLSECYLPYYRRRAFSLSLPVVGRGFVGTGISSNMA